MKQIVTESIFRHTMKKLRPNNFTWGNLSHLYDYFLTYEEDCETEVQFDPIAICCEFSEFKDLKEFQESYGEDYESLEDIWDNTTLIIGDDDSFIIRDF
jgi:hypothetical protein